MERGITSPLSRYRFYIHYRHCVYILSSTEGSTHRLFRRIQSSNGTLNPPRILKILWRWEKGYLGVAFFYPEDVDEQVTESLLLVSERRLIPNFMFSIT